MPFGGNNIYGSDLENVADPEAISGSYLGLLSGSNNITLGAGISGSIISTASFGLFVGDGAGLTNVSTETGSFASGSDVQGILDTYASGSDLQVILAESASYLNNDTTSSFGAVSMNSTLFVQGDITTSGSVVAQQFRTEFVSESII